MINDKTYYQILGVTPDAEDIVIRAAYKALSQRYHPDKFKGSAEEAETRMKEINIAYGILSDKDKRKSYDEELKASGKDKEFSEEQSGTDFEDYFSQDDADWAYAIEYFPKIKDYFNQLKSINTAIAFAFRQGLLEHKNFNQAEKYFTAIKEDFLSRYFGINPDIRDMVEFCIKGKHKEALREINKAVSVLGESLDADTLRAKLVLKFGSKFSNKSDAKYQNSNRDNKNQANVKQKNSIPNLLLIVAVLVIFFFILQEREKPKSCIERVVARIEAENYPYKVNRNVTEKKASIECKGVHFSCIDRVVERIERENRPYKVNKNLVEKKAIAECKTGK